MVTLDGGREEAHGFSHHQDSIQKICPLCFPEDFAKKRSLTISSSPTTPELKSVIDSHTKQPFVSTPPSPQPQPQPQPSPRASGKSDYMLALDSAEAGIEVPYIGGGPRNSRHHGGGGKKKAGKKKKNEVQIRKKHHVVHLELVRKISTERVGHLIAVWL